MKELQEILQTLVKLLEQSNIIILSGAGGTGKTFTIQHLQNYLKSVGDTKRFVLTATTNKACEALTQQTKQPVRTIHSLLGLVVGWNNPPKELPSHSYIVIDEASFIDDELLEIILSKLPKSSKVIFVGDPAQLPPINSDVIPVWNQGYPEYCLTKQHRQANTELLEICENFRNAVLNQTEINPVDIGKHIHGLGKDEFYTKAENAFKEKQNIRILAYTNHRAKQYASKLHKAFTNTTKFSVGDEVVVNSYFYGFKTDSIVTITSAEYDIEYDGCIVDRYKFCLEDKEGWFLRGKNIPERLYRHLADIRPVYASTVHKSQGSTYDDVYIDLNSFKHCRDTNTLKRLLYVAVSRARNNIYFTGDIY